MKRIRQLLLVILFVVCASPAFAQVYPTCPGPQGGATSCTMTILVAATATPIFAKLSQRQYLFLQNIGYTNTAPPVLSNNPVWCAIGSANNPIATGSNINTFVIQPGGVYQPPQIVKPQNAFTVPSGDVSCIAPLGNAYLTVEEE